jgi:hypothetical protein
MNSCFESFNYFQETDYLKKLSRILKLICISQGLICLLSLIVDISSGIGSIIALLILVLIILNKNWYNCIMYIILCLFDGLSTFFISGKYFAEHNILDNSSIFMLIYLVKFPFYLVAIYYTFLAYREYKSLFISHFGPEVSENPQGLPREVRSTPPPQPFTGKGYKLG